MEKEPVKILLTVQNHLCWEADGVCRRYTQNVMENNLGVNPEALLTKIYLTASNMINQLVYFLWY